MITFFFFVLFVFVFMITLATSEQHDIQDMEIQVMFDKSKELELKAMMKRESIRAYLLVISLFALLVAIPVSFLI